MSFVVCSFSSYNSLSFFRALRQVYKFSYINDFAYCLSKAGTERCWPFFASIFDNVEVKTKAKFSPRNQPILIRRQNP